MVVTTLRHILILFAIVLCNSCVCDHYLTKLEGLRSQRLYKRYTKKRINPEKFNLKTNILYKSIDYKYEEETKVFSKKKDPVALRDDIYLKFFKNGTYYIYSEKKGKKLTREDLDPKKGNFSYVINKNKKNIFMFYSTVNCGGFSKKEYEIKGDTLMISAGSNVGYRIWYYYLKHEVPIEWLDWETDI